MLPFPIAGLLLAATSIRAAQVSEEGSTRTISSTGTTSGLISTATSSSQNGTSTSFVNNSTVNSSGQNSSMTVTGQNSTTTSSGQDSTSSEFGATSPGFGFLTGLNLAGFDFGVDITGTFGGSYQAPPMDHISHFGGEGVNVFRLPSAWQNWEPNGPGTGIDVNFFELYDSYVQEIISRGAIALIDPLHNYARYNGAIIGQSENSPTNEDFAGFWSQIATKYANETNIIFDLMNEPHDLDMSLWVGSVQAAVDAIREVGATTQIILLPGTDFTSGGAAVNTNFPALSAVTDPVGGTDLLHFNVHQYLDEGSGGEYPDCTADHISDIFAPITAQLKSSGRKAFLSEIGGGSTSSCFLYLDNAIAYISSNSGQWTGVTAWSAGSFQTSCALSLTPEPNWVDALIWTNAILPYVPGRSSKVKRMKKHQRSRLEHEVVVWHAIK